MHTNWPVNTSTSEEEITLTEYFQQQIEATTPRYTQKGFTMKFLAETADAMNLPLDPTEREFPKLSGRLDPLKKRLYSISVSELFLHVAICTVGYNYERRLLHHYLRKNLKHRRNTRKTSKWVCMKTSTIHRAVIQMLSFSPFIYLIQIWYLVKNEGRKILLKGPFQIKPVYFSRSKNDEMQGFTFMKITLSTPRKARTQYSVTVRLYLESKNMEKSVVRMHWLSPTLGEIY